MLDLTDLDVQPPGFGRCRECTYRDSGSAAICYACAAATIDPVSDNRCQVCDQALGASGVCRNHWCRRPEDERGFHWIHAIAMRTGELERAIDGYKFHGRRRWAGIFGRVIVGYLDEFPQLFGRYDLIVASPAYTGAGARRSFDHVGAILKAAIVESGDWWPFDDEHPRAIVKIAETPQMSRLSLAERLDVARTKLRPALHVPRPSRVTGKTLLVVDDIFTEGTTLRETAMKLREAGARRVDGLVLARQPWGS